MEAARLEISSKAMAPLLREAYIERDLAREAALDAVARIDRNRFDIELPPDGRIEAAHLRRFHPEASAALREALDRAASGSPELAGALDRHRKADERCADLKCLTGEARDAYARKAAADLGVRCENAALRVMVPDRTPAREQTPAQRAAPATGPAAERRRGRASRGSRERSRTAGPSSRQTSGGAPRQIGPSGMRRRPARPSGGQPRWRRWSPGRPRGTPAGATWGTRPARGRCGSSPRP